MMNPRALRLFTLAPTRTANKGRVVKPRLSRMACIVFVFCVAAAISAPAQTPSTLASFSEPSYPSSLVQGTDGNFYGTTTEGGKLTAPCAAFNQTGCGTVFKITPKGDLTTLYEFCSKTNCLDGASPQAGLIQANDGNFYGTTAGGGASQSNAECAYGCGTIFRITPAGKLTTLYSFCPVRGCADGTSPSSALVQGLDGNLYGTAMRPSGTVFKMTLAGKLTTLYTFCAKTNCTDGDLPDGLIQATDGSFYGTTSDGGSGYSCYDSFGFGCGTTFRITSSGELTTLQVLSFEEGAGQGWLIQGADGNLYGTRQGGGVNGANGCARYGCGTAFALTIGGVETVLHAFCPASDDAASCTDGAIPSGGLIQATDGNFYGTASSGNGPAGGNGENANNGTLFQITPGGTLTTLYSFCAQQSCPNGSFPEAGLLQGTDGRLYGTTGGGGTGTSELCSPYHCGTVFSFDVGLGPFVSFVRGLGHVGVSVQILGQGFTGATAVSFNGIPASFTVKSDTYLTAAVPVGATNGFVTVTEPSGTLTSNKIFRVVPWISSFSPASGPVGTTVVIHGDSFTGAKRVVFACGNQATFTVDSDTQITATVPAGALTGAINVVTPSGPVGSTTTFTVTP